MFFLELGVDNLMSGSSAFSNPTYTSGSSQFMSCWRLAWRILSITLLAHWMSAIVWQFEDSLALPFCAIEIKTYLFQSYDHCWVFSICWHIECSTFRIWNNSAQILSLLPPLFVIMLPKAYLTSHSMMPNSRWMTTPSWLSGSLRPFLCSSSMCSNHFFLISFIYVTSLQILSVHSCMTYSLDDSNFMEESQITLFEFPFYRSIFVLFSTINSL